MEYAGKVVEPADGASLDCLAFKRIGGGFKGREK